MPQLMASRDTVLLHLIADTGNKTKKLRIREEFLPVLDVKVRMRVPDGRIGAQRELDARGNKLGSGGPRRVGRRHRAARADSRSRAGGPGVSDGNRQSSRRCDGA